MSDTFMIQGATPPGSVELVLGWGVVHVPDGTADALSAIEIPMVKNAALHDAIMAAARRKGLHLPPV